MFLSSRAVPLAAVVLAAAGAGACVGAGPPGAAPVGHAPPRSVVAGAVTARAPSGPGWARGAVFYEVFVRSFADSDGDGVGDLRGLTERLDYLNDGRPGGDDLGVDALWLMPVFESPSYHGYDTVDYDRIDAEYGTDEDFDHFLAEAHRRGLRVIVDLVLNHTSDRHPWFVASAASPESPYRPWYVWRDDDPGWTQPWGGSNRTWHPRNGAYYYGVFWSGMPDLDYRHPPVREEMNRVARRWLARGVDGFRLDATRHLFADGPGDLQNDRPATHAFLRELAAEVRAARPDALLVGENWTETPVIATYFGQQTGDGVDQLAANFDFPLAAAILAAARSGDASGIAAKLAEIADLYPPGAISAPFLTNHDMVRVATQLEGDPGRLRVAAAVLLTLPGAPFLYYGEEVGLANGPGSRDEEKRTPMPWEASAGGGFTSGTPWRPFAPGIEGANVAAQRADPRSLFAWYRDLIALRRSSPALRAGQLTLLSDPDRPGAVLAFERRAGRDTVLVIHNLAPAPATSPGLGQRRSALTPLLASPGVTIESAGGGGARVRLPGHGTAVVRVER
jgi:alpha-amylase